MAGPFSRSREYILLTLFCSRSSRQWSPATIDCRWIHSRNREAWREHRGVWFGLFDETGPQGGAFARLYLAGSESYDPDERNSGWACSPAYFPDGRYADSEVLRSMSRILSTTGEEISWLGSYVLPLGYASLAVSDACRQLQPDTLLGRRTSRTVVVGFDSGDFVTHCSRE